MMIPQALRAGLQSGSIMATADVCTQFFVEGRQEEYEADRTLRWALAGLFLHGPYFYKGFSIVDKTFGPPKTLDIVAKKTAVAQFILFPPYLVGLFGLMGLLEQHPDVINKIKQRVPEAFLGGCLYWPIANGLNFALVPNTMRVPYLACSAGLWNSYLSWANARSEKAAE